LFPKTRKTAGRLSFGEERAQRALNEGPERLKSRLAKPHFQERREGKKEGGGLRHIIQWKTLEKIRKKVGLTTEMWNERQGLSDRHFKLYEVSKIGERNCRVRSPVKRTEKGALKKRGDDSQANAQKKSLEA